ncbi:hypothetical protein N7492_008000 [Penicillium capsulatum]|uniref:Uncharacterized protein n=1 Tax=Penicillium capsulatum TaxID=69766 RepID=A0A9W9HQS5_9EURO|nr:hypothetical protein N7492_008000 [Penicillium capsulatum]KAJ6105407.1 hypothetical protein N7512_008924 [Penicillium capsulatum]
MAPAPTIIANGMLPVPWAANPVDVEVDGEESDGLLLASSEAVVVDELSLAIVESAPEAVIAAEAVAPTFLIAEATREE